MSEINQKMHANEVEINTALVVNLINEQFPHWANQPIVPVKSSGTSNAIYKLGEEMCIRLPRIPSAVDHVDKEFKWLPKLAPLLPLPVPTPIAEGEPNEDFQWPWTICPWLKGSNPVEGQLDNPDSVAQDLARFIQAMHSIKLYGGPISKRGKPLSSQDLEVRDALKALEGKIDTKAASKKWEQSLEASDWAGKPVWIHGDLMPGNLLIENNKLSAVLDFGCLGIGDPASDLISAWNLLTTQTRDNFRKELDVDDDMWERGRGWALSMALIQLPYYEQTNQVIAANARYVINEVLTSS